MPVTDLGILLWCVCYQILQEQSISSMCEDLCALMTAMSAPREVPTSGTITVNGNEGGCAAIIRGEKNVTAVADLKIGQTSDLCELLQLLHRCERITNVKDLYKVITFLDRNAEGAATILSFASRDGKSESQLTDSRESGNSVLTSSDKLCSSAAKLRSWCVSDVRHVRELMDDLMETRMKGLTCPSTACDAIKNMLKESDETMRCLQHEMQMLMAENQYFQDQVSGQNVEIAALTQQKQCLENQILCQEDELLDVTSPPQIRPRGGLFQNEFVVEAFTLPEAMIYANVVPCAPGMWHNMRKFIFCFLHCQNQILRTTPN